MFGNPKIDQPGRYNSISGWDEPIYTRANESKPADAVRHDHPAKRRLEIRTRRKASSSVGGESRTDKRVRCGAAKAELTITEEREEVKL